MTPDALTIRPLAPGDAAAWRRLWRDYLAFYETVLPEEVYAATWARLMGAEFYDPRGLLALRGDEPVGLVHFILHRTCWKVEHACYLQDLYADPAVRGSGVGRALIAAVYAEADALGTPGVYWMTQHFNATARQLYDRVGTLTPFVKYARPL